MSNLNVFPGRGSWFSAVHPCEAPDDSREVRAEGGQFGIRGAAGAFPLPVFPDCGRRRGRLLFGKSGYVFGNIAIHLDYRICDVKIGTGASGNNYGRNAAFFIKKTGAFNEGSDRLLFPADHALHQLVAYHRN